ncbi:MULTISPECIES: hypothetical protein [unclassified Mesorhizobium]|uniref:hypothetical protein n=1 Tax=unclassified Mesorhizobium TaxID=325217 RepID=UPI00167978C8|nr:MULTISPECIES: hypothetical protein [unclassified Mesorhizobium]
MKRQTDLSFGNDENRFTTFLELFQKKKARSQAGRRGYGTPSEDPSFGGYQFAPPL